MVLMSVQAVKLSRLRNLYLPTGAENSTSCKMKSSIDIG